jgi:hypothetical protein
VREGLVPLISDLRTRGRAPDASWLKGHFDVDKQAKLCKDIALDLGFDITRGRLDVSVHPFTGTYAIALCPVLTRFALPCPELLCPVLLYPSPESQPGSPSCGMPAGDRQTSSALLTRTHKLPSSPPRQSLSVRRGEFADLKITLRASA